MGFLSKLFSPARVAASGSQPLGRLTMVASEVDEVFERYDIDVISQLVADTNSMLPTFDCNAVLMAERAPFSALRIGDIVIYWPTPGEKIVHRIVSRAGPESFWMQGDNLSRRDPLPLTPDNYDRRVCGILYSSP